MLTDSVSSYTNTYILRSSENVEIDFGAAPTGIRQCNQPPQCIMEETVCGYTGLSIAANTPTTFRVRIGRSGGSRGYQSITGEDPF